MTAADFNGITQIRTTPEILRRLLAGVSEEEAGWEPAADRWSVNEVLGHLCHVEEFGFTVRVREFLSDAESPRLEPYDPDAYAASGAFAGRTVAGALDEFERKRAVSMELLDSAPAGSLVRTAIHGDLGPVTFEEMLNEWALHDLGHVKQIIELIRAVRYFPRMGAWKREYRVKP